MGKLLLIVGFVLTLSTLGFAAANANAPGAPDHMVVDGQSMPVDYD